MVTKKSSKGRKASKKSTKSRSADTKQATISVQKKGTKEDTHFVVKYIRNFFRRMINSIFAKKSNIKLGIYGPPNAGPNCSIISIICNKLAKMPFGKERVSSSTFSL